jgi:phosphatidylinositol alpha 1,6-mannosyltransferase
MGVAGRSMRIALFSGNYNYVREGANQALNRLVGYLEQAGHQVRVYSPVTDTPAFEPVGTLIPVPSVALPVRSEFRLALGLPRRLRKDIQAFAPDLFHIATPDILGSRAQTFAKRLGVPIVASLHTRFETYLEHYGLGWARKLAGAHLRRFYRRSDDVLVPNIALRDEMRASGVDHVGIWSRGVDRALFDPARRDPAWRAALGVGAQEVVILFFGRLVAEKGVDTFIATIQRLRSQGASVRPLIVGAGPAADRFRALSNAVMTGHLKDEDLAAAIAGADILLNPSTTEAFGNVVLEAMASGLAVVSADVASARALIDPGVTGVLCPAGDIDHFAATLSALTASPEMRQALGRAARIASTHYVWDSASRSVEAAYAETIARAMAMRRQVVA